MYINIVNLQFIEIFKTIGLGEFIQYLTVDIEFLIKYYQGGYHCWYRIGSAVLGGIGRYWAVLGGIGQYWAVLGGIGRYWAVLGGIGRYLAVFGCIWRYLAVCAVPTVITRLLSSDLPQYCRYNLCKDRARGVGGNRGGARLG